MHVQNTVLLFSKSVVSYMAPKSVLSKCYDVNLGNFFNEYGNRKSRYYAYVKSGEQQINAFAIRNSRYIKIRMVNEATMLKSYQNLSKSRNASRNPRTL